MRRAALLVALLVVGCSPDGSPVAGSAGLAFFDGGTGFGSGAPRPHASLGDFDGDGDLDVVTASAGAAADQAEVWLNPGDGGAPTLAWSEAFPQQAAHSVEAADVTGDGLLDAVFALNGSGNRVYEGDGFGNLSLLWEDTDAEATRYVSLADFDGDGDLDLAAVNASGQPDRLYLNDGDGSAWTTLTTDGFAAVDGHSAAWGDYDGDGDPDLAVGTVDAGAYLYENDAGAALVQTGTASGGGNAPALQWGDWDDDGLPELAVGFRIFAADQVYEVESGQLTPAWASSQNRDTLSVAWGDLDGDGDLDLVQAHANDGQPGAPDYAYLNDGDCLGDPTGCLVQEWTNGSNGYSSDVALADWNGDGALDAIVTSGYPPSGSGGVGVLFGEERPFVEGWVASADWLDGADLADVDGDGDLDIGAVHQSGGESATLYFNDGTGSFSASPDPFGGGSSNDAAFADADGDGDLDAAFASDTDVPDAVYLNDGLGAFTLGWQATEVAHSEAVSWGDADGDGDLDLHVASCAGCTPSGPERLYLNDGLANFTLTWTSPEPQDQAEDAGWGDLDGDGDLDLAVVYSSATPSRVRVWENDGAGGLTELWSGSGSLTADLHSVALGDVDLDGDLDIVVGGELVGPRVFENLGGGIWDQGWVSLDCNADAVALADLDQDGDPDLVTQGVGPPSQCLFDNDGTGNLGNDPAWESDASVSGGDGLVLGDLDRDGDCDMVAGAYVARVYLNGTVGPGHLSNNPTHVAAAPLGPTPAATGFAWPTWLESATVTVPFTLFDDEDDPAPSVRLDYQLHVGGGWAEATLSPLSGPTAGLAASPDGTDHALEWSVTTDLSDEPTWVRTRVVVEWQAPSAVANPIAHGALQAVSPWALIKACVGGDGDDDGFCDDLDCDDTDPDVYPGATEVPDDGTDQDCDGFDGTLCWDDLDGDGFGADVDPEELTFSPDDDCEDDGEAPEGGDCDDGDATVHPGADDVVGDGVDSDCDGGDAADCFEDLDGDGWGGEPTVDSDGDCFDDDGQTGNVGDCDDFDPSIHPGAVEYADDGVDQDCNGTDVVTCFLDVDGDGFGGPTEVLVNLDDCADAAGYSADHDDCDDGDVSIHPGAAEACDEIDSDCDQDYVDGFDNLDGDELPDCVDPDADGDFYEGDAGGGDGRDCDDLDATVHPDQPEACDGVDTDCNGAVADENEDRDGDGFTPCEDDCDDGNAGAAPGFPEICDDVDQDCDGSLDCEQPVEALAPGCDAGCDATAAAGNAPPAAALLLLAVGLLARRRRRFDLGSPLRSNGGL